LKTAPVRRFPEPWLVPAFGLAGSQLDKHQRFRRLWQRIENKNAQLSIEMVFATRAPFPGMTSFAGRPVILEST